MIKVDTTAQRLTLRSGSTTVVLDKSAGKALLLRKLLFWSRKPIERPLGSVIRAKVDTSVDPASKAELCSVVLMMREGDGWLLSARDRQDATTAAGAVQEYAGIR